MLSEKERHILKKLMKGGVRAIMEFTNSLEGGTQKNREGSNLKPDVTNSSLDTDFRINRPAKPGEKVIALSHDDRAGVGESIDRGEILTVKSIHLDSYTFIERPAYYDPYLGEEATPWHRAKSYMLVNDISRAVVEYLNDIEASTKAFICGIADKIQEYRPKEKVGMIVLKGKIEIVLSEYEAVVLECTPVFEESIKEQYDVREFIRILGGAVLDKDVVIDNNLIGRILQEISNAVKKYICAKYHNINIIACERLTEDIAKRYQSCIEFDSRIQSICDSICNAYMEYIIESLA